MPNDYCQPGYCQVPGHPPEHDEPRCKCQGGEFVHPRHVTVSGGSDYVTGIDHSLPLTEEDA